MLVSGRLLHLNIIKQLHQISGCAGSNLALATKNFKTINMNKQTATEWLVEQQAQLFNQLKTGEIQVGEYEYYLDLAAKQAEQMEKERIINAFKEGNLHNGWALKHEPEEYYNKTFKQ